MTLYTAGSGLSQGWRGPVHLQSVSIIDIDDAAQLMRSGQIPEKDVLDSNCLMTTTQLMNSVDLTRRRTEGERGGAELHQEKEKK